MADDEGSSIDASHLSVAPLVLVREVSRRLGRCPVSIVLDGSVLGTAGSRALGGMLLRDGGALERLEELRCFSCGVGSAGVAAIASAVAKTTALRTIDLGRNRVDAAGVASLADGIRQALPRRNWSVGLSDNPVVGSPASSARASSALRQLVAAFATHAEHLDSSMDEKVPQGNVLKLSNVGLGWRITTEADFYRLLPAAVVSADLSDNKLGGGEAAELLKGIKDSQQCRMRHLDVRGNKSIGAGAAQALNAVSGLHVLADAEDERPPGSGALHPLHHMLAGRPSSVLSRRQARPGPADGKLVAAIVGADERIRKELDAFDLDGSGNATKHAFLAVLGDVSQEVPGAGPALDKLASDWEAPGGTNVSSTMLLNHLRRFVVERKKDAVAHGSSLMDPRGDWGESKEEAVEHATLQVVSTLQHHADKFERLEKHLEAVDVDGSGSVSVKALLEVMTDIVPTLDSARYLVPLLQNHAWFNPTTQAVHYEALLRNLGGHHEGPAEAQAFEKPAEDALAALVAALTGAEEQLWKNLESHDENDTGTVLIPTFLQILEAAAGPGCCSDEQTEALVAALGLGEGIVSYPRFLTAMGRVRGKGVE